MIINLKNFYEIQKELNEKILKNHNLTFDKIKTKSRLSLLAELMELCNETRCFNYWSQKKRSSDEIILEEYSDVLCFLLSECIYYKLDDLENIEIKDIYSNFDNEQLTNEFLNLIKLFIDINSYESAKISLIHFFELGYKLGYNEKMIFAAYQKKCIKNHSVQDNWKK